MIGADILIDTTILSFVSKSLKYRALNNPEVTDFLSCIEGLDICINDNARGVGNIPNIILINIDGEV